MLASKHKDDLTLTPRCYHTHSAQSYLLAISKYIVCTKFIFLDQWLISLPNSWRCLEIQWLFIGITRTGVGGWAPAFNGTRWESGPNKVYYRKHHEAFTEEPQAEFNSVSRNSLQTGRTSYWGTLGRRKQGAHISPIRPEPPTTPPWCQAKETLCCPSLVV